MLPSKEHIYFCYSKSKDEDEAKNEFRKAFQKEPEQCFLWKDLLWVGPIREVEKISEYTQNWKDSHQ